MRKARVVYFLFYIPAWAAQKGSALSPQQPALRDGGSPATAGDITGQAGPCILVRHYLRHQSQLFVSERNREQSLKPDVTATAPYMLSGRLTENPLVFIQHKSLFKAAVFLLVLWKITASYKNKQVCKLFLGTNIVLVWYTWGLMQSSFLANRHTLLMPSPDINAFSWKKLKLLKNF